jgi:RNA polymerase sigma-70 factor (ECF subfamily)
MTQPTTIPEKELISLIQAKNKAGFEILYENYSGSFYHFILRSVPDVPLAEDILQESFVKIWKGIYQYDESKGKLYTWMLRIVKNTSIDYLRSQENKHKQLTRSHEVSDMSIAEISAREVDFGLRQVVSKLEPKHREVIDAIYYGSHTNAEAAEKLGIPLGTLKSRARLALHLLRSALENELPNLNIA